jgi:hypothetical protein
MEVDESELIVLSWTIYMRRHLKKLLGPCISAEPAVKTDSGQSSYANSTVLLAIGRRLAKRLRKPIIDHSVLLYDKHGLPK